MINLHHAGPVNTFAIYPESGSIYAYEPDGKFELTLTQDYNQSESVVIVSLINNPTEFSPRLVFQANSVDIPKATGLYTIQLKEFREVLLRLIWGQQHTLWGDTHVRWDGVEARFGERTLDTDRAYVSGSDIPSFNQYISPDEDGRYITYRN